MHLIKKIFTIVFFSMSIYSQDYYGRIVDIGNISEAGTDIIIYFEENTVRAYLRNYTNRFGNRYFDLFGRGSANDSFLELHSIVRQKEMLAMVAYLKFSLKITNLYVTGYPLI